MKHTLLLAYLVSCIFLSACQSSSNDSTATYDIDLVESKKITLPIDENTYYFSHALFQYEEDGKEYLSFENTKKHQYNIHIYDISSQEMVKTILMQKEGPNGVPAVRGSRYVENLGNFLLFQHNARHITLYSAKEEVLRNYRMVSPKFPFIGFNVDSYYYNPSFLKDSVLYLAADVIKPNIKKEDWKTIPMLLSVFP